MKNEKKNNRTPNTLPLRRLPWPPWRCFGTLLQCQRYQAYDFAISVHRSWRLHPVNPKNDVKALCQFKGSFSFWQHGNSSASEKMVYQFLRSLLAGSGKKSGWKFIARTVFHLRVSFQAFMICHDLSCQVISAFGSTSHPAFSAISQDSISSQPQTSQPCPLCRLPISNTISPWQHI